MTMGIKNGSAIMNRTDPSRRSSIRLIYLAYMVTTLSIGYLVFLVAEVVVSLLPTSR